MNPTLKDMQAEIRSVGDFNDTSSVTDGLLRYGINSAWGDLWDMLGGLYEAYFERKSDIALVANQEEYALPDDLQKLLRVKHIDASNQERTLVNYDLRDSDALNNQRSAFLSWPGQSVPYYRISGVKLSLLPKELCQTGARVRLTYVPKCLELIRDLDELSMPVPCTWRRYVVTSAIVLVTGREESDTSFWQSEQAKARQQILDSAPARDAGAPPETIDVYRRNYTLEP